jgi:hypothetical protein
VAIKERETLCCYVWGPSKFCSPTVKIGYRVRICTEYLYLSMIKEKSRGKVEILGQARRWALGRWGRKEERARDTADKQHAGSYTVVINR